jgi:hypothetical protein
MVYDDDDDDDDVSILDGITLAISKNTEALLIDVKEIGLEVNAEKTKYMVMSRDQNAGQNGYIQIGNESLKLWNSLNIWEQP